MEAVRCKKCQALFFPKRLICTECGAREFEVLCLSGRGTLVTFTITQVAPEGFVDQVPYAVGIVEMEEGVRVMGQITDCDPNDLKIGDSMVTQFRRIREEGKTGVIMYAYKFVPELGL
jgi:uncharacterized OB-fold protein